MDSSVKNFRVILIDNNSSDIDEFLCLYECFSVFFDIHLVKNESNLGYTGGNNKGYIYLVENGLSGDLLIINPDVILEPHTISSMKAEMSNNVGGVMIRTLNSAGDHMYDYITLHGLFQKGQRTSKISFPTDYLAGSCMLLSRSAIDRLGLFDERYFLYWEEVDLSLRLIENGYHLHTTTNSIIKRTENSVSRSANAYYYFIRNSFLISKKFSVRIKRYELISFLIISFVSSFVNSIKYRDIKFTTSAILGFLDGMRGVNGQRSIK
ncbi:glycosyltransferase family 2 protein [Enterovibrio norvegicus]